MGDDDRPQATPANVDKSEEHSEERVPEEAAPTLIEVIGAAEERAQRQGGDPGEADRRRSLSAPTHQVDHEPHRYEVEDDDGELGGERDGRERRHRDAVHRRGGEIDDREHGGLQQRQREDDENLFPQYRPREKWAWRRRRRR